MRDFIKVFLQGKTEIVAIIADKKIKIVCVKSYPPNTDKEYLHSGTFFDFTGNKIEYKSYKAGKIVVWEKFTYDNDGKLTEVLEGKTKWSGGSYNEKDFQFVPITLKISKEQEIEELNEKGQKIVSTFWEIGKIKNRKFFNENSICIEVNEFTTKGALINKELYDANGQLIEARRFRSNGSPLNYTVNTYNEKSQLCRSISVSRTGYVTYDTVLKYNKEGLLIEYIEHPVDAENAYADLKGESSGYGHKYFYTEDKLLDTDKLYLCGEHIMSYKYTYEFW